MSVEFMLNGSRTLLHEMREDVWGPKVSKRLERWSDLAREVEDLLEEHKTWSAPIWWGWCDYIVPDDIADKIRSLVGFEQEVDHEPKL